MAKVTISCPACPWSLEAADGVRTPSTCPRCGANDLARDGKRAPAEKPATAPKPRRRR